VPQFGYRLDVNRLLVLALDQERVAVQVNETVDLLDGRTARRHVVGILRLQLTELERPHHQMLQRLTAVPAPRAPGRDLSPQSVQVFPGHLLGPPDVLEIPLARPGHGTLAPRDTSPPVLLRASSRAGGQH